MFETQLAALSPGAPRSLDALPGLALSSAIPRSALLLPGAFALFFLLVPLSIMRSDPTMRLHWGTTAETQGTVVSVLDTSCRAAPAHRLTYRFTAGERGEFRGAALECQGALYYALQPGDALQLRYLVNDPTVSALRGAPDAEPPMALFALMPLTLLVVVAAMYAPQARAIARARRVVRLGQLTEGRVLYVKRRGSLSWPGWQAGGHDIHVEYTAGGARCESVAWCGNEWLVGQWGAGSTVHLAYLEGAPNRVAILDAFIR